MARDKVQFQRGLSDVEFERLYGTEEKCREALLSWRWPAGFEWLKLGCSRIESASQAAWASVLRAFLATRMILLSPRQSLAIWQDNRSRGLFVNNLCRGKGADEPSVWSIRPD